MEDLLSKHRKELRDLQAKITQKKKAASKKTRKGVNEECARLEEELKQTQAAEITALDEGTNGEMNGTAEHEDDSVEGESESHTDGDAINDTTEATSNLSISKSELQTETAEQQQSRKPNRQKARLARRAAEQAELAAKAEEEAKKQPDLKTRERATMLAAFKERGLKEKEIRADGHCLYSAVADQLTLNNIGLRPKISPTVFVQEDDPFRIVRKVTAEYINTHADDFVPFLEEPLNEYVRKVGETGEWGGQLELTALAKAYEVKISVLDGDGSVHEIEGTDAVEKEEVKRIWLAYYRHGFGLGEHYNSLRKA